MHLKTDTSVILPSIRLINESSMFIAEQNSYLTLGVEFASLQKASNLHELFEERSRRNLSSEGLQLPLSFSSSATQRLESLVQKQFARVRVRAIPLDLNTRKENPKTRAMPMRERIGKLLIYIGSYIMRAAD